MLKYLTHKLKTQSINEENLNEKIDCHDSGTESDGDLESEDLNERDMELSMSSLHTSPDSERSPTSFLSPQSNLFYNDQHSSEEELEVIMTKPIDNTIEVSNENVEQKQKLKINNNSDSPKRCSSSTFLEKRKRSLAHNSDDELLMLTAPVNFRTTPPIEALKPHRGHLFFNHQHLNKNIQSPTVQQHQRSTTPNFNRSTTPLILVEAGRGIENIRISCDNHSPLTTGSGSSSTPSSSSLDLRSISPPTKVFAISPRRNRTPRNHQLARRRPCLDFDKMQLKARNWNNNDGDLSVFCW
ncbi:hypothetical protein PVAND_004537 [Polypedilum vanderplanki]|uniref:Uncharacterized protein n=1 Tax=Polypedilum vanderplanki TaxID=319348 RepID=A0A9J6BXI4_POLVA|nr:hypothetical protein PVAND_004537 [Polypedilum vanderplanki]